MIPTIRRLAILLALLLAASPALAQAPTPPAPSPADMEQAKKLFLEGKALFDAKKYFDAATKFKEAHKLSQKVELLNNIGAAFESAGEDELALTTYRKFMKEAPATVDATLKANVQDRITALEKKLGVATTPTNPTNPTNPGNPDPNAGKPKAPITIKPPGTYSATDFQHQAIDAAPPAKPLDITAFVPEDSGFVVTLYFRTAGEGKYASKEMKWRYKELVARIPPNKMIGTAVHYYIEVKDQAGTVVTRAAKSTSPNLVNLEAGAAARFYPDLSEDGGTQLTAAEIKSKDDDDDPLNKKKKKNVPVATKPEDDIINPPRVTAPGNGFIDAGSQKFKYTKWGATIATATFLAAGVYFNINANQFARALEDESKLCGAPPCAPFDEYARDTLQNGGKTRATLSNVAFGVGAATAVVAAFYWYRELTSKKRVELKASKTTGQSPEANAGWIIAPTMGESGLGAAAALRF